MYILSKSYMFPLVFLFFLFFLFFFILFLFLYFDITQWLLHWAKLTSVVEVVNILSNVAFTSF